MAEGVLRCGLLGLQSIAQWHQMLLEEVERRGPAPMRTSVTIDLDDGGLEYDFK